MIKIFSKKTYSLIIMTISLILITYSILQESSFSYKEKSELLTRIRDAEKIIEIQQNNYTKKGVWLSVKNQGETDCHLYSTDRKVRLFDQNLWEDVCFTNLGENLKIHFEILDDFAYKYPQFLERFNDVFELEQKNFLSWDEIHLIISIKEKEAISQKMNKHIKKNKTKLEFPIYILIVSIFLFISALFISIVET